MSRSKSANSQHPIALDAVYSTPDANSNVQLYKGAITLRQQTRLFSLQRQCEKSSWTKCCVAGVGSVKPELVGWLVRNGPDVLGM